MFMGRSLVEFDRELARQKNAKKDYRAHTSQMHMENGNLIFGDDRRDYRFPVNSIATQQIATFTGIPAAYYQRMQEQNPALLDENINAWFGQMKALRMIRTLDDRARAFLSDKYLPIDNWDIARVILPIINDIVAIGDDNVSCQITDSNMYIKVVNHKLKGEVSPGDLVQSGIMVSNSEVGRGMVEVKPFLFRLVCRNGMVVDEAAQKRRHVGKTIDLNEDEYEIYREETINAANNAFLMKVEDTVRSVVDESRFDRLIDSMREAKDKKFTNNNIPAIVELTAKRYGIADSETDSILSHLVREGDTSVYGLANAVTRHSQDVGDYDHATKLEAIGGKIIAMPDTMYRELNHATSEARTRRSRARKTPAA